MGIVLIASASASDLNETALSQIDEDAISVEEIDDNCAELDSDVVEAEKLCVSEDTVVLSTNHTPKNSAEIQTSIDSANDGDTIILDGYYLFNKTITVNKPLNFVGKNYATVDGNNSVRLFSVSNGVTFKNITFKNGVGFWGGGAIAGSCSVVNCSFVNNSANQDGTGRGYGSAVYLRGGSIVDCSFVGNSVDARWGYGGAVYFDSGEGSVVNCSFVGNSVDGDWGLGGAVCFKSGSGSVVNCSFSNNFVPDDGGAVCFESGSGSVVNCSFSNNIATGDGGAIAGSCSVVNCSFVGNSANGNGGAVYFERGDGSVVNCSFVGNSAKYRDGGAVYKGSVVDCSFVNNYARYGGAIYNGSAVNCIFESNTGIEGKALYRCYAEKCTFKKYSDGDFFDTTIVNCDFESDNFPKTISEIQDCIDNAMENSTIVLRGTYVLTREDNPIHVNKKLNFIGVGDATFEGNSRGIFDMGCVVSIYGITFKNYYSDNNYNVHVIQSSADLYLTNCKFINCTGKYFSAIKVESNRKIDLINCYFESINDELITGSDNVTIQNCYFVENSFGLSWASVVNCSFVNSSCLLSGASVVNCSFVNNYCKNEYGILYRGSAINCVFIGNSRKDRSDILRDVSAVNCTFINNSVRKGYDSSHYGAIRGGSAVNCTFINNSGGVIAYGRSAVNCTFIGNSGQVVVEDTSVVNCIFVNNSDGVLLDGFATNCVFINNSGGAIGFWNYGGNISVVNCSFVGNSRYAIAGVPEDSEGSVVNCSFVGNSGRCIAAFKGSVVNCSFVNNSDGVMDGGSAVNCIFINNSGSIRIYGRSVVNCSFVNNSAYDGGAVYFYFKGSVVNCTFINNSAERHGGAVYFGEKGCSVVNCSFVNNSAYEGGAVYFDSVEGSVVNCSFVGNTAGDRAGAMYGGSAVNCSFVNNSAKWGGTLYLGSNIHISGCAFINDFADYGGAIIVEGNNIDINNCQFRNCYSTDGGGAIYWYGNDNLNITYCTFNNCTSGDGSSYLEFTSSTGNYIVSDCLFDEPPEGITYCETYNPVIKVNDLSFYKGDDGILNIKLYDIRGPITGKTLTLTVNNRNYTNLTDLNGFTSFNIGNYLTEAGNYTLGVSFAGEGLDNPASKNVIVLIKKYDSFLTANDVSCYVGENGYLNANLSLIRGSLSGKTIILTVNGKTYSKSTSNGMVTFNVKDYLTKGGFYEAIVSFAGDDYNNPIEVNASINLTRYSPIMTYNNISMFIGEDVTLRIGLSDSRGALVYKLVGFNYGNNYKIRTDNLGFADFRIKNYITELGDYNITVSFDGDDEDNPVSTVVNIKINKYNSTLAVNDLSIFNDEEGILTANLYDCRGAISGKTLIFNLNGVNYTKNTDNGGSATFNIKDYLNKEGNYSINVIFEGDDYISPVSAVSNVKISRHDSQLAVNDLSIFNGDDGILVANLSDVRGAISGKTIIFTVNGVNHTANTDNAGLARFNVKDYLTHECNCSVDVIFAGDDFDKGSSAISYVNVYRRESDIEVNSLNIVKGDNGFLIANLSDGRGPLANKLVIFTVNGANYTNLTGSDGLAKINIKNYLTALGDYVISVVFAGDDWDKASSANASVRVNNYKGLLSVSQIGHYYSDTGLSFKLINLKNDAAISNAKINVVFSDGSSVNLTTDSKGIATYDVPFAPGIYSLSAGIVGDCVDVNGVKLNNFEISKIVGKIAITQLNNVDLNVRLYNPDNGEGFKNIKVTLRFDDSRPVEITTNENGVASYAMSLNPGGHSVTVTVDGNYTEFEAFVDSIEITNSSNNGGGSGSGGGKLDSKIDLRPIVFYYGGSGSTTFTIIGGIVESSGISIDKHPEIKPKLAGNKITVSGLDVGTYTLRVKTTPDENYYSVTETVSITVKKISAKISVKKISMYHKDGKKWTIELRNSITNKGIANMEVKLKVFTGKKSKVYSVKTDSKGVATFKASNKLSVGKHKVIINFSKHGYDCNPVTSSVTVKKVIKLVYSYKVNNTATGSMINLYVKNKATKKPINGVALMFNVYYEKKVHNTYKLVTGNYKDSSGKVHKGFVSYSNSKIPAGKHKLVFKPTSGKYRGSITIHKFKIKKEAKKHRKIGIYVSNGKSYNC